MHNNKKLILIELNELNLSIVEKYSQKYKFKFFNKNFFENLNYTYSEDQYDYLEPWIQWVSVHSGKSAKEHNVFRLGDITKHDFEQIFEKIEKLGFKVGAISPMNTVNKMKNPKYFISDPWTDGGNDGNQLHETLSRVISRSVNSNSTGKILFVDYLILIISLLKYARLKNYVKYLLLFFQSFKKKWHKAFFLDLFLNDLHFYLLKKFKVDFSCIFFNAGAHIQHHYFLNSEFISSEIKNPSWYLNSKYDPIKDAIVFYDNILSEYFKLDDYEILIATGLSQEPYDRKKYYYRLKNHKNFLEECKINYKNIFPRMTRDFEVEFNDEKDCYLADQQFNKINILNKKKIFNIDNRGKSLFLTLLISEEIKKDDILLINEECSINLINYVSFVALKNGMHNSKGYLYCSNKNVIVNDKNLNHVKELNNIIFNFFNK